MAQGQKHTLTDFINKNASQHPGKVAKVHFEKDGEETPAEVTNALEKSNKPSHGMSADEQSKWLDLLDKDSLRATQPFDITSIREYLYPARKDMSDKKSLLLQVSTLLLKLLARQLHGD